MPTPKSAPVARRAPSRAEVMMQVRRWHSYIGAFIAPAILFFAITGGFQLFNLHESHGDYRVPPLLEKLGEVHKKQRFAGKAPRPSAAQAPSRAEAPARPQAAKKATPVKVQALKWFFLLATAGLVLSTLLGVWLALTFSRNKPLIWALLAAGAALPVLLTVL